MKINYIQLPTGKKLISYYTHDFKSVEIDGKLYMIDGGQEDYCRYSGDLKQADCYKLIETIREEYLIGQSLLKNIQTYILQIHLKRSKQTATNDNRAMLFFVAMLKSELKYRKNNNMN
jgi:hypothetical protein